VLLILIFTKNVLQLSEWKSFTNNGFTYKIMTLTFPINDAEEWKKLFKPCAAQRLFLPVNTIKT
jgi:UDP-xylose:glucoside alpha-1,3-xylosyltransferase